MADPFAQMLPSIVRLERRQETERGVKPSGIGGRFFEQFPQPLDRLVATLSRDTINRALRPVAGPHRLSYFDQVRREQPLDGVIEGAWIQLEEVVLMSDPDDRLEFVRVHRLEAQEDQD